MSEDTIRKIKRIMEQRGITQADLAKLTKISASSISDYLTGKYIPKQDKLAIIAESLGVSPAWLMGYGTDVDSEKQYYLNPETARLAQEVYDNPDLRILFDASRHLTPEDIKFVVEMVKKMKGLKD